ncbi:MULTISPECIES: PAS domain S-box protein [Campylobacter]|uniref:PAS domain S-box protein n=1 Tax=Campylobacter porcelli TaxID=1660073 RepID=A0ABU7M4B2_9BACT|nr:MULTISPECIES: PAS domain S-box protein [unclassified Campylobacter]MCR8679049.1 PAS domain S-box protein [Campylobacter sp. RM19072]MCR8696208.1 PAS domain S-box protein [Campylobacter sp. RM19073]MEE3744547.1 PAS domain S-box protein [Campylobacter sp. CX2-4855-23]
MQQGRVFLASGLLKRAIIIIVMFVTMSVFGLYFIFSDSSVDGVAYLGFSTFVIILLALFLEVILYIRNNLILPIANTKIFIERLVAKEVIEPISNLDFYHINKNIYEFFTSWIGAQNSLKYYIEYYSLLFDKSDIKILFIDAKDGSIMDASRCAVDFYGYSKGELLTMSIFDIQINYDTKASYHKHRLSNGEIKFVEVISTPVSLYFNDSYFMIILDATKAQEKIESLNSEIAIIENNPAIVVKFTYADHWVATELSSNINLLIQSDEKNIDIKALCHSDDIASLSLEIERKIKLENSIYDTKKELDRSYRFKLASGEYGWFRVFVSSSKNINGQIEVIMFLLDNTDQEILKEILTNKLKRCESRILSSDLLGFEYFAKSGALKFSVDFVEFLGYKNSIDMGVSSIEDIYKIVYRDDIDILIDELDRYIEGTSRLVECDIRLIKKDGKQIYTKIKAKALDTLNDSDEIIGTATDISDHQNYIVQSALTNAIMSSSINGIMICDVNGNILDINDSFSKITGYSKYEIIGKTPQILRSDRHDNVFYAKMWSDIKHFGSWSGKIYNKNRAGEVYLEHLVITAIKDEHGIIQRYIASFYKIME